MKCKALKSGLSLNPYPHIVIDDYAGEDDFRALMQELIRFEQGVRKTQEEGDMTVHPLGSPKFTTGLFFGKNDASGFPAITKFLEHFSSSGFLTELAETFAPYAPGRMNLTSEEVVGLAREAAGKPDIAHVKFSGRQVPKLRDAHVDGPQSIMTFLFYTRLPNDFSTGGNLYLHSEERSRDFLSKVAWRLKRALGLETFVFTKAVEFKANTFVAFLNGRDSVHEVSMRRNVKVNRVAFHGGLNSHKGSFA